MSDEYYRPTYTFPHGAYNATEVRLYGKPGIITSPGEAHVAGQDYEIQVNVVRKTGVAKAKAKSSTDALSKALRRKLKGFSGEHPEFGLKFTSALLLDTMDREHLIMVASASFVVNAHPTDDTPASWGVIYGYAYEGHSYDLPKPKLMLLPTDPEDLPVDDAGYTAKADAGYKVWVVDKLDKCLEVEVNQGFVEQLVLDANLPGKRSPTMYASKMMMGHRSGKLND